MVQDGCSIALFDGDAVLLIQRAGAPFLGYWTLPGGRIELGESPEEAVCREAWEELGLIVASPHFVGNETVVENRVRYQLAVYAAHLPHRAPVPSPEILNWEWVRPQELAGYHTTPDLTRIIVRAIARLEEAGP